MGPHSRSGSVSSASSHSSHSRPTSATGPHPVVVPTMPQAIHDDSFRHFPIGMGRPGDPASQSRHPSNTSQSTAYSNLSTPIDSPPHGINVNIGKTHLPRSSHLRARAAASPYARDNESIYSSSSETEDLAMFLAQGHDYSGLYPPMTQAQNYHHSIPPHHLSQEPVGAFGRMTLSSDQTLEHLAANVRSATTTSSSDRAKQIFVQAW
jgi:regulatory factor X